MILICMTILIIIHSRRSVAIWLKLCWLKLSLIAIYGRPLVGEALGGRFAERLGER